MAFHNILIHFSGAVNVHSTDGNPSHKSKQSKRIHKSFYRQTPTRSLDIFFWSIRYFHAASNQKCIDFKMILTGSVKYVSNTALIFFIYEENRRVKTSTFSYILNTKHTLHECVSFFFFLILFLIQLCLSHQG